jgi:hypothetical protein
MALGTESTNGDVAHLARIGFGVGPSRSLVAAQLRFRPDVRPSRVKFFVSRAPDGRVIRGLSAIVATRVIISLREYRVSFRARAARRVEGGPARLEERQGCSRSWKGERVKD